MKHFNFFLFFLLINSICFSQETSTKYTIPTKELNEYMRKRFLIIEDNPKIESDIAKLQIKFNPEGRVSTVQFLQKFQEQDTEQILEFIKQIKEKDPKWKKSELILEVEVFMPKIAGYAGAFKLITSIKSAPTKIDVNSDKVVKIEYSKVKIDNALLQKYEYNYGAGLAKECIPFFNEHINSKLMPRVMVLLIDKSTMNGEYAWLNILSESNGNYEATISSPPRYIQGFNVGQKLSLNKSDILDWSITDKRKIVGNFTNLPSRNATILENKNKLEPYINTNKIIAISKAADEAIIPEVETKPDVKASFVTNDTSFQKYLIKNQVINITLNRRGFYYREVVENDMYQLIEVIRYAYNLDQEGSPLKDMIASFHVMKDGTVVNPRLISGGNTEINPEIIRCLNNMEKWNPALKNGQTVNSLVVLDLGTMEVW